MSTQPACSVVKFRIWLLFADSAAERSARSCGEYYSLVPSPNSRVGSGNQTRNSMIGVAGGRVVNPLGPIAPKGA